MKSILKAEKISKSFGKEEKILKGITMEIEQNSFTVMLGQSGSGKMTLLSILSGLRKPTGNIFQNYLLLGNLTVRENIEITILFVTHNLQIAETANRVITIKDGRISRDFRNEHPISPKDMVWG